MENPQNQNQSQSRFLIAMLLSMVVLFAWSYFYAPTKPKTDNANTANTTANSTSSEQTAIPQLNATVQTQVQQPVSPLPAVDNTPSRQVTIKTPLYEVKLDSKGGVATAQTFVPSAKNVTSTTALTAEEGSIAARSSTSPARYVDAVGAVIRSCAT